MNEITILGTSIRQDAHGRYCLNDLHRAAGGEKRHQPSDFLRSESVRAFVAQLDSTPQKPGVPSVQTTNGGKSPGTYAAELVVYRYAAWISAAFEVQVYSVFRDWANGEKERIRAHLVAEQDRQFARLEAPAMTAALKDARTEQGKETAAHHYSNEMDMINRLVLGATAKQYRLSHGIEPATPLRDALIEMPAHISAIRDLQRANQTLIELGMDFQDRKAKLSALLQKKHTLAMTNEVLKLNAL